MIILSAIEKNYTRSSIADDVTNSVSKKEREWLIFLYFVYPNNNRWFQIVSEFWKNKLKCQKCRWWCHGHKCHRDGAEDGMVNDILKLIVFKNCYHLLLNAFNNFYHLLLIVCPSFLKAGYFVNLILYFFAVHIFVPFFD